MTEREFGNRRIISVTVERKKHFFVFYRRLSLVLCFIFLLCLSDRAGRFPIKTFSTADGLRSSSVTYITRDSSSFLWFCTRDGLSRFDGYHFINYKIEDSVSSQTFEHLLETRDGVYWATTNGGGLYRFDLRDSNAASKSSATDAATDGRTLLKARLVSNDSILTLFEDGKGNLWAGKDGLFRIEETDGQISLRRIELGAAFPRENNFFVFRVCEGRDGSLWLATSQGLLRRLPDGRVVSYTIHRSSAGFDSVRTVIEDGDGRIWIGHESGLYVFKPEPLTDFDDAGAFVARQPNFLLAKTENNQTVLPEIAGAAFDYSNLAELNGATTNASNETVKSANHQIVLSIYQASDGRVWVATAGGLAFFDGRRFQRFNAAQNLASSELSAITEDADGDLWLGSLSGAIRLSAQDLTTFDLTDNLGDARIQSIYEDADGSLYVVNGNWFVSRYDGEKFTTVRPNIPPDAKFSWASNLALRDHNGEWWFLTYGVLYRFARVKRLEELANAKPLAVYTKRDGLKNNWLFCLFEDSRGDIWISSRSGADNSLDGLTRWQRSTGKFQVFSERDGLPQKSAASFAEDADGDLWFGFYQGGAARFADGRFTEFSSRDGLPEGVATGLYLDGEKRLWMSASGGAARVDNPAAQSPQFIRYTMRENLSSDNVRSVTGDAEGKIYFGTVRGVDRLTPESGAVKHFDASDGLAADFVKLAFRDRSGAIWFGTFNGLSRLDPRRERVRSTPSILINGLRVAGVAQAVSELGATKIDRLNLNAAQNNLQIDFFSLSLAHAASLRYQYKLEGADADWSPPSEQRTVNYANLAPGNYRFLVRAVNADGAFSAEPATISFAIAPPVWQRSWFIALAVLLICAAAYALYKYRVRQLLEVERVRTRIAADLHDDIGASLSRVAILSEVIRLQNEIRGGEAEKMLAQIADSARELLDSMSDIVWSIDPRRDDLHSVVTRVHSFASDVLESRGIRLDFETSPEIEKIKINANQKRQILLIFKEVLNNAARHADCANVRFAVRSSGKILRAEIADDGRGFAIEQSANFAGNGLRNIRTRVAQIGGEFEIDSAKGEGTRLKFVLPCK
ncbi:MAG: histidine kinase [Acidobacteriota bacterium]|nr:histidine kinase [Acidobacteriota bacterium]